jgi:HEAT repeat protein
MVRTKRQITISDLETALKSRDPDEACFAFMDYSKQRPTIDAVPLLRKALRRKDPTVVRSAAVSLEKLGQDAIPAVGDLFIAAKTTDESGMPQSYPECVRALAAIPHDEEDDLLDLISHWAGVTNWGIVSAGMSALQKIATPKATALLRRIHAFWYNNLNKTQKTQADKFLKPMK